MYSDFGLFQRKNLHGKEDGEENIYKWFFFFIKKEEDNEHWLHIVQNIQYNKYK